MRVNKYFLFGLLFIASAIGSFSYLSATDSSSSKAKQASRVKALEKLTNVINMVEKNYVEEVSIDSLVEKAISGMLSNLDAHSTYLDEKSWIELQKDTSGEFSGVGISIGVKNGVITVIAPLEGSPASKAGIMSGDVIVKIDKSSTLYGMTIGEAVSLIQGKKGTKVDLTVVRKEESKPLTFTVVRDIVKIASVAVKRIEDTNFIHARVFSFDSNTTSSLTKELAKHKNIEGIVLDLRGNPGGLLDQAVSMASLFIKKGVIIYEKGSKDNKELNSTGSTPYPDVPLAVIVNGGSASASEIVAGALQDKKRAVLIGETTYGKGSVQQVLPISDTEALKLTVAKYYLPSFRSIQAVWVKPDIEVASAEVPMPKSSALDIKEADYKTHLKNELLKVDKEKESSESTTPSDKVVNRAEISKDLQLKTAVDVLSSWAIIRPKTK